MGRVILLPPDAMLPEPLLPDRRFLLARVWLSSPLTAPAASPHRRAMTPDPRGRPGARRAPLLLLLLTLAACEGIAETLREDPLVRDIAEHGEVTIWRDTF